MRTLSPFPLPTLLGNTFRERRRKNFFDCLSTKLWSKGPKSTADPLRARPTADMYFLLRAERLRCDAVFTAHRLHARHSSHGFLCVQAEQLRAVALAVAAKFMADPLRARAASTRARTAADPLAELASRRSSGAGLDDLPPQASPRALPTSRMLSCPSPCRQTCLPHARTLALLAHQELAPAEAWRRCRRRHAPAPFHVTHATLPSPCMQTYLPHVRARIAAGSLAGSWRGRSLGRV